jgi:6-pyruvoyl-tetrahydropterin synthase
LNKDTNWVIDIRKASSIVEQVLAKYNFKNMDQVFSNNELTTMEFMAKTIHADICQRLRRSDCHFAGKLLVKLWESHKAWATYCDKV